MRKIERKNYHAHREESPNHPDRPDICKTTDLERPRNSLSGRDCRHNIKDTTNKPAKDSRYHTEYSLSSECQAVYNG